MYARALKNLAQASPARRLDVIAQGLDLLVEHVARLTDDLIYLADGGRTRGSLVLEAQGREEAAKVLILLDLVRLGVTDWNRAKGQVALYYDHLARCIYAELATGRPADFAEVREMVENLRQAYYLDGPNDVDWIFRNQLLSDREEDLYVDYVQYENTEAWITPASRDAIRPGPYTMVQELVVALHRLGVTSRRGLQLVADAWAGQVIDDKTRWEVVAGLSRNVLSQLRQEGAVLPAATARDAQLVVEQWTFPLHDLDLTEADVKIKDLEDLRDRRFAAQSR